MIVLKNKLLKTAVEQMRAAYCPYSGYSVGAALLCADGTVYCGSNIENASFTPTVCAERVAFFKAVSEGKRDFKAIAIAGGKDGKIMSSSPCGVCRQVMAEFCAPDFSVLIAKSENEFSEHTLEELLPLTFKL